MQMPFCAIMRSWTLLAAFGGSYAPDNIHTMYNTHASLSVEKLLATARSGTHTNIINYYIYIHIFLRASPIVEKLVAFKCCTYTKLAVTVTTFANKPLVTTHLKWEISI